MRQAHGRGSLVLLTDSRATHRGALLSELAARGHVGHTGLEPHSSSP